MAIENLQLNLAVSRVGDWGFLNPSHISKEGLTLTLSDIIMTFGYIIRWRIPVGISGVIYWNYQASRESCRCQRSLSTGASLARSILPVTFLREII